MPIIISANPIVISLTTNYPRWGILILRPPDTEGGQRPPLVRSLIDHNKTRPLNDVTLRRAIKSAEGIVEGSKGFPRCICRACTCDIKFYWNAPITDDRKCRVQADQKNSLCSLKFILRDVANSRRYQLYNSCGDLLYVFVRHVFYRMFDYNQRLSVLRLSLK